MNIVHYFYGHKINKITGTLNLVSHYAKYAAAASSLVIVTTTLIGADAVNHFRKIGMEMSKSLRSLCDSTEVSTNLKYQDKFPQWVYDFVSDQTSLAAGGAKLGDFDSRKLPSHIRALKDTEPKEESTEQKKRAHYFFVYHPASDWHAAFNKMLRENPLPGFIGATNNLNLLGLYLSEFRQIIGPEPEILILLPSAHMYVIEDVLSVAQELLPLKIVGQRHRTGHPYVHVAIKNLSEAHIRDVGILIMPNEIGASTVAGAVAGGIGAGVAAGVLGAMGAGLLITAGCTVAGPAALAYAAAYSLSTGGAVVGGLASGSTAAALTGIHIAEKARWKDTGRGETQEKKEKAT